MWHVIELLADAKGNFHHVRLNASFHSDLVWRDTFLEGWNGTSFLTDRRNEHSAMFQLYSDVSEGSGVELIGIANGFSLSGQRVGVVAISRLRRSSPRYLHVEHGAPAGVEPGLQQT